MRVRNETFCMYNQPIITIHNPNAMLKTTRHWSWHDAIMRTQFKKTNHAAMLWHIFDIEAIETELQCSSLEMIPTIFRPKFLCILHNRHNCQQQSLATVEILLHRELEVRVRYPSYSCILKQKVLWCQNTVEERKFQLVIFLKTMP